MFMYLILMSSMRNQRTEVLMGVDLMISINFKFHDIQFGMASSFLDNLTTVIFSIMKISGFSDKNFEL